MEHKTGAGRTDDLFTLGEAMSSGFERFWQAWPKSQRKGAKQACAKKWATTYLESCADQIIKHVEWMKTTDQWRKDNGAFIPAPLVYLNQQRWDGAEVPEIKPTVDAGLQKIKEDAKQATRMPDHVRQALQKMRGA